MSQFTNRPREPVRISYQPDVMPHDVLNVLHVAMYQRRIRFGSQITFIPGRYIIETRTRATWRSIEDSLNLTRGPISPNQILRGERSRRVDSHRARQCS